MTRAKISEYSATAGDNTDVNGVNIAEGCPPSSMNNMGREIMAALKRYQVGSDGDGVTVGGNLVVSGTATVTSGSINGTTVGATTASTGSFTTLNTSGQVVFNDAGADVDFRVEGDTDANLLFVDASTDRVGIGKNNPGRTLDVNGTIGSVRSGSTAAVLQLINDNNSWNIVTGTSTAQFRIDNNLLATALTIDSSNNVGIGAASPAVKLEVVGQVRASTGILFGSDTAAANALDDYEEGTFTATLTCNTGTITMNSGVGGDEMRYTKIGRMVTVAGRISVASVASPTGFIKLNLPFAASPSQTNFFCGSLSIANAVNLAAGQFSIQASGVGDTSSARIFKVDGSTVSSTNPNAQELQSTSDMSITLTYFTS